MKKKPKEKKLPTWHTQALKRNIDFIVLVYEKAEGFAFRPTDLEKPFSVGGDYGGHFDVTAKGAIEHYERFVSDAFRPRVEWFMEYVHKVDRGEDFSLDDLNLKARNVKTISGRWPW